MLKDSPERIFLAVCEEANGVEGKMSRGRFVIVLLSWCLVFLWMGVVHSLPEQMNLAEMTPYLTRLTVFDRLSAWFLSIVGRKFASIAAYGIMGLLVCHGFARFCLHGLENCRHTLMICLLFAVADEMHQLLLPGHGFSAGALLVDGFAVLLGLAVYQAAHVTGKRMIQAREESE